MTFGLNNSVIRCFGELVLIYTFIITNHSLSTTLKGGGERVVKDSCRVIIKFVYSRKGSLVIQWSPSLIGSQFSIVPLPLYSGSNDDWLPFHPPWKSCNTPKSSDPSPLESNNDWFLSLKIRPQSRKKQVMFFCISLRWLCNILHMPLLSARRVFFRFCAEQGTSERLPKVISGCQEPINGLLRLSKVNRIIFNTPTWAYIFSLLVISYLLPLQFLRIHLRT